MRYSFNMRIFIDIGHPAHVHYFRNFIKIMENKGHIFFFTARDKEVAHSLLKHYKINYSNRGKGSKNIIGKLFYILIADILILKYAIKFKPDIFLSFASPYLSHVSKIVRKPHIAFDDTEHAKLEKLMYLPFTDVVLTPSCFSEDFGKKQIYFNSYMEYNYLHKKYFKKNLKIKQKLGLIENEKYVILRFVSWSASHDIGQSGINDEMKYKIIEILEKKFKVFISSESLLPANLEKYRLKINPADLHSVLAGANLYVGEGSTTASECSILGIPNIYVNSLTVGYCTEQDEKYGLCIHLKNDKNLLSKINELMNNDRLIEEWSLKREKLISEKIDITSLMVWFVENYPDSVKVMRENPDYQYNFR